MIQRALRSIGSSCLPHHTRRYWDAIGHDDKEKHVIEGANHYYFGQPDKAAEAVALCCDWLDRHEFL